MRELIFWGSYLYFPLALLCVVLIFRGRKFWKTLAFCALVPATVLAYARFIEPQILNTVHTDIDLSSGEPSVTLRAAVFADTHYGTFLNAIPMKRIVRAVNAANVDVVFIPGDFVYHAPVEDLQEIFAPLAELDAPVFAVLGNHDVGYPGADLTASLVPILESVGVTLVENRSVEASFAGRRVTIAGASDLWQDKVSFQYSGDIERGPVIFLAHNPDTAYIMPPDFEYDILIAGHTHGGQIRVPGMLERVIPTNHPFDHGLYELNVAGKQRRVFVTPGIGMVGLPMRFRMLPRIDILNLQIPEG